MSFILEVTYMGDMDKEYLEKTLSDLSLSQNYLGLHNNGASYKLYFDGEITPTEQIQCQNIFTNYANETLAYPILQDLVPEDIWHSLPLESIDYKKNLKASIGRLHPNKTIFVRGEVQQIVYYQNYDGVTFSNPVVCEDYAYTRDGLGFAQYRTQTIRWFDTDGNMMTAPVKNMLKFYTPTESIAEGKRRRQNVVDSLEYTVLGYMLATIPNMSAADKVILGIDGIVDPVLLQKAIYVIGKAYLTRHSENIELWQEAHDPTIVTDITNDTDIWLNNVVGLDAQNAPITIRDKILDELFLPQ